MAQSIISDRAVLSFDTQSMLASLKYSLGLSLRELGEFTSTKFPDLPARNAESLCDFTWQGDLKLLIEQNYCRKDGPKYASWFNCVPISCASELICAYIKKALGSFEGGSSTFKGKSHTKPEQALRKLRDEIEKRSIPFDLFLKYNRSGIQFSCQLIKDDPELLSLLDKFDVHVPEKSNDFIYLDRKTVPTKKIFIRPTKNYQVLLIALLSSLSDLKPDVLHKPHVDTRHFQKPLMNNGEYVEIN